MNVWIIGGGINQNGDSEWLDNSGDNSITYWQGNVDTKRGDIVLVYCLSPRSYIHSVWRAKTDGFIEPFFYFYNSIWICSPIKIVPITYEELRNDPILSQNGLVKGSMQGINGRKFTFVEYEAILDLLQRKGQDISVLPKLEPLLNISTNVNIKEEKDVENQLIEPLLGKLGYTNNDWTRQMAVRMGSGEKIYPDYAFFIKEGRGEEQAKMILEAKYRIRTQKELFKAYWQAKSYALRLQSRVFAIAAIEGLWIFSLEKSGFGFEKHVYKTWKETYHPDIFPTILNLIGKQSIKKIKAGGN
ncbi:MAG: hypothetical protein HC889_08380 [Synechococcaceae cyanobacterium SM1_2_3]|nr:hypothetical protein [Synechococcaceae cyanobacterium SM1_2_3]